MSQWSEFCYKEPVGLKADLKKLVRKFLNLKFWKFFEKKMESWDGCSFFCNWELTDLQETSSPGMGIGKISYEIRKIIL